MRLRWKYALSLGFVGMVAMAASAFGQSTPGAEPTPSPGDGAKDRPRAERCFKGHRHAGRLAKRLVHSESIVQTRDGFTTVIVDHGTVTSSGDSAVTIRRADGVTVTATAGDGTRVCRDGERASLSALESGDLARLVQVRTGDGTTLRAVMARSEDAADASEGAGSGRLRRFANPDAAAAFAQPVADALTS